MPPHTFFFFFYILLKNIFWSLDRNRNLFATKDDLTIPLLEAGHGLLFPDSVFGPKAACPAFEVLGL